MKPQHGTNATKNHMTLRFLDVNNKYKHSFNK